VTAQRDQPRAGGADLEARIAQLEAELAATALRLQADRLASMGTLAAGVAHEVNNPLGFTLANVTFALEELRQMEEDLAPPDGGETVDVEGRLARARARVRTVVDALQEARQGSDRVRLLVRDLKTFAGADVDRHEPVDIRRVLEAAINMAYNAIRPRARLVKDYDAVPAVDGNEARLAQVFLNLLLNAAEATREGDAEGQQIRVVLQKSADGRCVVEVSDTGRGIPPEELGRVLDPFFTTKPGHGTGLGLAMSHTIVAGLGGEIAIESEVGRGSTVRVTLPASKELAPPASGRHPSDRPMRRARVLVIDDEPMMARAVQRLLGSEHDVDATTDPPGAVARVRAGERFDVILCDLMMPGMTGMDVHEAVLAIDEAQARRMVFMTGGAFAPRASAFLERVENPRVEKPLDRSALRALIRAQLG
jgi:signal transduction histidine kinase